MVKKIDTNKINLVPLNEKYKNPRKHIYVLPRIKLYLQKLRKLCLEASFYLSY